MSILIAAIALAAAQNAADPSRNGEHRLTPDQIEAVLAAAAARREAADERAQLTIEIPGLDPLPPPQLHGEFGIGMGTGGYSEVFGTGIYPMGQDGVAAVTFDFVDFGNRSYRRDRY